MVDVRSDMGFTVTELIVTLIVISVFATLFFQMFMTGNSQQVHITRQAVANDIAMSNLSKITSRALIPITTTACQTGGTSQNNLVDNPDAPGSIIATSASGTEPKWLGDGSPSSGLAKESLNGLGMPSNTIQELRVFYPQGCSSSAPAKIVSTVIYGSESVSHASFVK